MPSKNRRKSSGTPGGTSRCGFRGRCADCASTFFGFTLDSILTTAGRTRRTTSRYEVISVGITTGGTGCPWTGDGSVQRPISTPPANVTANIGQRSDRNILWKPPLGRLDGQRTVACASRRIAHCAIETEYFRCRGHIYHTHNTHQRSTAERPTSAGNANGFASSDWLTVCLGE